jgi:succinyl-diaminopimelate desuccinylase
MTQETEIQAGRQQLLSWLDGEWQQQQDFLVRFAKIDTANPPGDTREGVRFIADFLGHQELATGLIDPAADKPNLFAHLDGGQGDGEQLILNGHVDVFPVGDLNNWQHDPFGGEIVDNKLVGRGVVDMKCGTTASIFTYLYLSRLRHLLSGKLTLCVVSDEETGGYWGSDYLLREHRDEFLGDCVLNGEPSSVDTIRFGEKAPFWFRIDVRTPGGHGAYPHLSRNAIRLAMEVMQALYELEDTTVTMPDKVQQVLARPKVAAAIEKGLGTGASEIVPRITLNIGRIEGGVKVNMAADACSFEVDARLPVGIDNDDFLARVRQIVGLFPEAELVLPKHRLENANWCDPDGRLLRIMQRNVQDSIGITAQPIVNLGATDCRFWRNLGVPAYVHGCSPEGMGAPNEAVDLDEFFHVVRVHALSAFDYLTTNSD